MIDFLRSNPQALILCVITVLGLLFWLMFRNVSARWGCAIFTLFIIAAMLMYDAVEFLSRVALVAAK